MVLSLPASHQGLGGRSGQRLAGMAALLLWGMNDPAAGSFLPRRQALFQRGEVIELAGGGQALPEECGPESATASARFLGA